MIRVCIFLAMSLWLSMQVTGQFKTYPNDPFHLKETTLSNGMKVYLLEDSLASSVYGVVGVRAGSRNDPADATGMAHYLEHMLFKGTDVIGTTDYAKEKPLLDQIDSLYKLLPLQKSEKGRQRIQRKINQVSILAGQYAIPGEFSRLLSSIGATDVNAATYWDRTLFHSTFPTHQMERWLDLHSQWFINPVFRLFQSELEVVYEEFNRYQDNRGAYMGVAVQSYCTTGKMDIIPLELGTPEHLKNPNLSKMKAFFDTYYVANNMCLILCGNFNAEKIVPIIEQKFGRLQTGVLPETPVFDMPVFQGTKILDFPVGADGIQEEAVLFRLSKLQPVHDLIYQLLVNSQSTGLLDGLVQRRKIEATSLSTALYAPGNALFAIYVCPNQHTQTFEEAEKEVWEALQVLKEGNFTEEDLEIVKQNRVRSLKIWYEKVKNHAHGIMSTFLGITNWPDEMVYLEKLQTITKAEVVAETNRLFGQDRVCIRTSMQEPTLIKLRKPGFTPVLPPAEAESVYARSFRQVPSPMPVLRVVDFTTDVRHDTLASGVPVEIVYNPKNDVFDFGIRLYGGTVNTPILGPTAMYMNRIGTQKHSLQALRKEFSKLGALYFIEKFDNYLEVRINGFDKNLPQTVALLQELLYSPQGDTTQLAMIQRDYNQSYMDKGQTCFRNWVHGPSTYQRFTEAADQLHSDSLLTAFQKVLQAPAQVFYTGQLPIDSVRHLVDTFPLRSGYEKYKWNELPREPWRVPQVLLYKLKGQTQNDVYIHVPGKNKTEAEKAPLMAALNEYMNGGLHGIFFQEIRELRSLAYIVGMDMHASQVKDGAMYCEGYMACQTDKTTESLETLIHLLQKMPYLPQRMDGIRNGLISRTCMSRPDFRWLSRSVVEWKRKGYTKDPAIQALASYQQMTFQDMMHVYEEEIQDRPFLIIVCGDWKKIHLRKLRKQVDVEKMWEL